jgi:hypothetical protein
MKPDKILSRTKRPSEEFRLGWDFVNDVENSDSGASLLVKAYDVADGSDVSATFLQDPTLVGNVGEVQIQAGTDEHDYDVRFQLTTTQGDVFQRVVRIGVRV